MCRAVCAFGRKVSLILRLLSLLLPVSYKEHMCALLNQYPCYIMLCIINAWVGSVQDYINFYNIPSSCCHMRSTHFGWAEKHFARSAEWCLCCSWFSSAWPLRVSEGANVWDWRRGECILYTFVRRRGALPKAVFAAIGSGNGCAAPLAVPRP